MQNVIFDFQKFLRSKYLVLLFSLLLMILFTPVINNLWAGKIIFAVFFLFVVTGIFYGLSGRRHTVFLLLLTVLALGVHMAGIQFPVLNIVSEFLLLIFYVYTIGLFCKDIYGSKIMTIDILLGSVCVYLLIGISFALIYKIIHAFNAQAVVYLPNNVAISNASDYYYFSFITLTTTGFGDIVVQSSFAKNIVIIESTVGTFYIAIMVARIVALFSRQP